MCSKPEVLRAELERLGIHTDADFKTALKKTVLNISLMAAGGTRKPERMVG